MKNFQQNLLILLALGLCGLCAFQWYEQTVQRNEIGTLNGVVYQKNIVIRDATNSVAELNHQLAQLDARLSEVKGSVATNEQQAAEQRAEITRLRAENIGLTNQVAQYQTAVNTLEAKLKEAYGTLEKQNDVFTNLVAQRDEFVTKYNNEVKDRNDIVAKYNELADQVKKLQSPPKQ
jgi:chromosome segregation ATPase